jgi:hypothetical protein
LTLHLIAPDEAGNTRVYFGGENVEMNALEELQELLDRETQFLELHRKTPQDATIVMRVDHAVKFGQFLSVTDLCVQSCFENFALRLRNSGSVYEGDISVSLSDARARSDSPGRVTVRLYASGEGVLCRMCIGQRDFASLSELRTEVKRQLVAINPPSSVAIVELACAPGLEYRFAAEAAASLAAIWLDKSLQNDARPKVVLSRLID